MMNTVTVEVPEFVVKLCRSERDVMKRVKESLVLDLVREHKLSFREGAEVLNMEYEDFLDLMTEHDVPMIDYEPGELQREIEAVEKVIEAKT